MDEYLRKQAFQQAKEESFYETLGWVFKNEVFRPIYKVASSLSDFGVYRGESGFNYLALTLSGEVVLKGDEPFLCNPGETFYYTMDLAYGGSYGSGGYELDLCEISKRVKWLGLVPYNRTLPRPYPLEIMRLVSQDANARLKKASEEALRLVGEYEREVENLKELIR